MNDINYKININSSLFANDGETGSIEIEGQPLLTSLVNERLKKGNLDSWLSSLSLNMLDYMQYDIHKKTKKHDQQKFDIVATATYLYAYKINSENVNTSVEELMDITGIIITLAIMEKFKRFRVIKQTKCTKDWDYTSPISYEYNKDIFWQIYTEMKINNNPFKWNENELKTLDMFFDKISEKSGIDGAFCPLLINLIQNSRKKSIKEWLMQLPDYLLNYITYYPEKLIINKSNLNDIANYDHDINGVYYSIKSIHSKTPGHISPDEIDLTPENQIKIMSTIYSLAAMEHFRRLKIIDYNLEGWNLDMKIKYTIEQCDKETINQLKKKFNKIQLDIFEEHISPNLEKK